MKSYYDIASLLFVCNSDADSIDGCAAATVLYDGSYIKPMYDLKKNNWFEGASLEEIEAFLLQKKTILAEICDENNYMYLDELQIEYDKCGFLTPKEAKYGLKGVKISKNYYHNDKLVVSQLYETHYETKTHLGFEVKDIPIKTIKKIRFFIDENRYKEKVVETLNFDVTQSEVTDQNGDVISVVFSSMKLEKYLKKNRQEADALMKSFNSVLYEWLYASYGRLYVSYLDTGNSTELKQAFESEVNPTNLFILNKIVDKSDLAILLGEMEVYPTITVKQLIIMNLQ